MTDEIKTIDGNYLIEMGFTPSRHFPMMLKMAKYADAMKMSHDDIKAMLEQHEEFKPIPTMPLKQKYTADIRYNLDFDRTSQYEINNVIAVRRTMDTLMRTPVTVKAAVMPDAMPAGPEGTIPVGGVVASTEIHPGMHSSDICCSLFITQFDSTPLHKVMDAIQAVTHFGPGGRPEYNMSQELEDKFRRNKFLNDARMIELANAHMGTQGDGNHFAYVGTMTSSGDCALVTHHGSRAPGALLYKRGKAVAEKYTHIHSPDTLKQNAWIKADSDDGREYWAALKIIRDWTKENHETIHNATMRELDNIGHHANITNRYWNEHNFVFYNVGEDLYYHAKGSTPAFDNWAWDSTEHTIIPLNMTEPILIVKGKNNPDALGFSPHGAGRNYSRTEHKRIMAESGLTADEILEKETAGIDARFFGPNIDVSELPSAYKNAASVKEQIIKYDMAEIVDEVLPYGCIMAGEWKAYKPEDWSRNGKV